MTKLYKLKVLIIALLYSPILFSQKVETLKNTMFHEGNNLPWYAEFSTPAMSETAFWAWFNKQYPDYQIFSFQIVTDEQDNAGFRHIRYYQTLNQYPVNHTAIILHLKNGKVESFNTDLFNFQPKAYSTHLDASYTLTTALKHYKNLADNAESGTPEFIWAKKGTGYGQDQFYLCHAYRVNAIPGSLHEKIYINESTGEIVLTENLIVHADTLNKSKTLFRGVRNFTADFVVKDSFRLRESGKRKIETYKQSSGNDFWNKTNNWKDSSLATNDIHWGTEVTMDMLKKRFNINSFDNKGTLLYSLSQPSQSGNAYWTLGGNFVNYFTGTSGTTLPCASLDVVGHELGHGVLDGISKLVYSGESGGLHESFGDIQGYIVERTGDSTKYDWIVGDQVWTTGGIRNMARPKAFSNPNTYKGQYWGGGFHSDAGVQNHWFYTMVHGDTGTNDNSYSFAVKGLGFEKSVSIVYRAIQYYISPNTDFSMVATFDVKSAKDLYGSCGPEALMTKEAWKAAGIIDTTTTVDYSHGISNQQLFCGTNNTTVPFSSRGDISRKCTWYFSKTDTLVAQNINKNFTASGTYTIYLKTEVCNKKFMDTSTTSLSLNPVANLKSVNAKLCQASDSLVIVNTSINTEPTKTIYYAWIVGPFSNYTNSGNNIKVAKDIPGEYYVELKAYFSNGCKDTATLKYELVSNVKPSFTAKNVCPCQDLKLKNTTDISGSKYTFKWIFDDTTSKTLFQPLKNYCRSGNHNIILNSTDLVTGCSDTAMRQVMIFDRPVPKIEIESFCFGDSVKLYDKSTHNRALLYNEWTFGFWNPQNMNPVIFKVADTLQKTFALTVYDDLGCSNTTSITAKPEILEVDFTTKNYCTTQSTDFKATIVNRMPVINYFWTINNVKKYAFNLQPSEKFTPQIVTATFWANTKSCKAIQTKSFEVFEVPKADFAVQSERCSGDSFYFQNKSNYSLPVAHEWDFSGTTLVKTKDVKQVWNNMITTSYTVCLKEKNSHGCADSLCKVVTVIPNPICDFTVGNFWFNYDGRGYKFLPNQNTHTDYTWDFGDGTTGNTANPTHQYTNDGKYNIKVKIKSSAGCMCEGSSELTVRKSGLNKFEQTTTIKIYPNPNEGIFKIEGSENSKYDYSLYSLDGKQLLNKSFVSGITEDLRELSKGIYLIRISDGNVVSTHRIELR